MSCKTRRLRKKNLLLGCIRGREGEEWKHYNRYFPSLSHTLSGSVFLNLSLGFWLLGFQLLCSVRATPLWFMEDAGKPPSSLSSPRYGPDSSSNLNILFWVLLILKQCWWVPGCFLRDWTEWEIYGILGFIHCFRVKWQWQRRTWLWFLAIQ